jgi:Molybdopterin oxidoreductase
MMQRFSNIYGCQNWHPAMICWGLGGFGVGLTGALKVNTKEDMAENSKMIVLWGSNIASQPNTARHIISARRRGAKVIAIDVRRTEAAAQSDEVLIRPGSDAALALALMHVIITERLYDPAFVETHTIGFEELSTHVLPFTPAWGAEETGLEANQIISFARAYASTRPAMILLGGSSWWLPAAQGAPRRLCRSKLRLAIPEDRVLLVASGETRVTTAPGARGRQRLPVSAGAELRKNTDALSFILRRGASAAIVGKAQHCASTLDLQGRR